MNETVSFTCYAWNRRAGRGGRPDVHEDHTGPRFGGEPHGLRAVVKVPRGRGRAAERDRDIWAPAYLRAARAIRSATGFVSSPFASVALTE